MSTTAPAPDETAPDDTAPDDTAGGEPAAGWAASRWVPGGVFPVSSASGVSALPDPTGDLQPRDLDPEAIDAVERELHEQVERRAGDLTVVDPRLDDVLVSIDGALGSGKRLRATFCVWGARAAQPDGARLAPGVVEAAAALEMFHLAALVHDDVMDHSDLRRGAPTVRRHFADRHRADGAAGDATAFGDGVAVLVGDLCLMWADELLTLATTRTWADGPARSAAVRAVWDEMRTQVVGGQFLDLVAQGDPAVSRRAIHRVLRFKSAGYTVEHPLLLGGTAAGASPALLDDYRRFARPVGEAFQLRDDVLGVFGETGVTGKPVADDVREGKRTLLVTHAEQRGTPAQRDLLRRHLGDPDLTPAGLDDVRQVLVDTGALDRVERRITELGTEAHRVVDAMPIGAAPRGALTSLVDACAWRAA